MSQRPWQNQRVSKQQAHCALKVAAADRLTQQGLDPVRRVYRAAFVSSATTHSKTPVANKGDEFELQFVHRALHRPGGCPVFHLLPSLSERRSKMSGRGKVSA